MNKKGFTLAELLGVIVILGLIVLVAFPAILDTIKSNKDNISDATAKIIISGANLYVNNNLNTFEPIEDQKYCIKIQTLIDDEKIPENIIDPDTNEKLDSNRYVKVVFKNNKYNYTIVGTEC